MGFTLLAGVLLQQINDPLDLDHETLIRLAVRISYMRCGADNQLEVRISSLWCSADILLAV
jgi:hypothetical protein